MRKNIALLVTSFIVLALVFVYFTLPANTKLEKDLVFGELNLEIIYVNNDIAVANMSSDAISTTECILTLNGNVEVDIGDIITLTDYDISHTTNEYYKSEEGLKFGHQFLVQYKIENGVVK